MCHIFIKMFPESFLKIPPTHIITIAWIIQILNNFEIDPQTVMLLYIHKFSRIYTLHDVFNNNYIIHVVKYLITVVEL